MGYAIEDTSPPCERETDTVFHRRHQCTAPEVVEARASEAPAWCLEATREASPPLPPTLSNCDEQDEVHRLNWEHAQDGADVDFDTLNLQGEICVNGSCTRNAIRDMQRASWCVSQLDDAGT